VKKKYYLCHIEGIDHCMRSGDEKRTPVLMHVAGYLIEEDDEAYYLASWLFNGDPDHVSTEISVVLKSAVMRFKRTNLFIEFHER
jgi:hypothetical protein